tara:strand:+ start:810 stop:1448 length:639 start_codon:yes stop_codon:yes gene_type:complete
MNIFLTQSFLEFSGTVFFGLLIYITLLFVKQKWVNTITYFITFLLLPATTYVITKVISDNLALSLGMIGALSIVRFRNPVKSPLELVIYFALITIGISMGVNHFWSIVFVTTVILVILFSFFLDKFMKKIKLFKLFEYSFNSNDALNSNILEIESDASIVTLEENPNLIFFSKANNKIFYKLGIQNREELKKTVVQLKDNKNIKSIEIQYSN